MIIRLTRLVGGGVRASLEGPKDFTRFHLAGTGLTLDDIGQELVAQGLGVLDGTDAYIEPAMIVRLSEDTDAAWIEGLEAMVQYASRKGWTDAAGRIQVHCELD